MTSNRRLWVISLLIPVISACNLLTPMIFLGEHKKRVLPEFDKLSGKRVAILVWTDASTLFDYPYARLELASYVTEKIFAELAQRKLATDLVDPGEVENYLQKNIDAQIDPQRVGRAFNTDYVVYLEVLRFQMRDPDEPQFLRGIVNATVTVHDTKAEPDELRHYELAPVKCLFPEGVPVLMSTTNAAALREATYRKFAEQVARKFYEHTLDL